MNQAVRWRWGLILVWALGLTAVPAAERLELSTQLKPLGYESAALRRTGQNHWFLFGQVEGQKRSCLIDTGWSFTTIATNITGALPEANRLGTLQLGRTRWSNVPVQSANLQVNGQPTAYSVVLGCDFLMRHDAILDCGNNRLYLRSPSSKTNFAELECHLSRAGWSRVELQTGNPPALSVLAGINNRTTHFLVDSGAMWSCLDRQFASEAGVTSHRSANRMMGPGAAGQRGLSVAELQTWSLAGMRMPERTFSVLSLADWGLGSRGTLFPDIGGIFGGAELKAWAAIIDCGNRKLWLRLKP